MKCRRCHNTAIISLPSHNTAFCPQCFLDFFSKQVERGIQEYNLMTKDDAILVALSGGKDSLALMLELGRQGYNVTGLHIDLGIPHSSSMARGVVERFCTKYGFPLIIKDMEKENIPIPLVKSVLKRPICSACGKIKRYYFNKTAQEQGFNVLATGHNLDDEVARLTSNTLRWDTAYLSDQGPILEASDGFSKKVKPLWRLTEFEIANYAFIMGIENHYAPCPYSQGASFSILKKLWITLEEEMPGRKMDFYQGFLARGQKAFSIIDQKNSVNKVRPCIRCGFPTSAEICGVCRIKETISSILTDDKLKQ